MDGNNVETVFQAVSAAVARAAEGAGPSLIECVGYRWEPHSIFTRPDLRPKAEIEEWKQRDPIGLYRTFLLESQVATADALSQIESQVKGEAAKASVFANGSPAPDPERAFQDVYA